MCNCSSEIKILEEEVTELRKLLQTKIEHCNGWQNACFQAKRDASAVREELVKLCQMAELYTSRPIRGHREKLTNLIYLIQERLK